MIAGVNGRFLSKPFTGIGQHTINLLRELAKIDKENEYIFVHHEPLPNSLTKSFSKNCSFYLLPEKRFLTQSGAKKTFWEQIQVPDFFVNKGVDLAFFPYPSNSWSADYRAKFKSVVVAHDLIPYKIKGYRGGILSKMYHHQTLKALKKADLVLTVSQSSKSDLNKMASVPNDKVKVIFNDVAKEFKKKQDREFCAKTLNKYGLKKDSYFVYVGGFDKRKNVDILIRAFDEFLKRSGLFNIQLAILGKKIFDNDLYNNFEKALKIIPAQSLQNIVQTGFIEEKEMSALLRESLCFVNFSSDEGFNIPVLEGANCGAPLLISDIKVHREITLNKANYVKWSNFEAVVKTMLKIGKSDKRARGAMRRNSLLIAKNYSWERSAQQLKNMLRLLYEKR